MRSLLVAGMVILAVGCGGESSATQVVPPAKEVIAGTWTGGATGHTFDITVVESNGIITGNGTWARPGFATVAVTVQGTYSSPAAVMTLTPSSIAAVNLSGNVKDRVLDGRLNGSGFNNEPVTLVRR